MLKKVYKVLLRTKYGKLFSACVYGKAKVRYYVGKQTLPPNWLAKKGYHLLVFKTLHAAELFIDNCTSPTKDLVIREAWVSSVKHVSKPYLSLWLIGLGTLNQSCSTLWPPGTYMTKWLIVIPKKEKTLIQGRGCKNGNKS